MAAENEPAKDADGVFGNLPSSRPGARSPRRTAAGNGAPTKAVPAAARRAKPRPAPPPPRANPPRPPAPDPPTTPEAREPGQRIASPEDLAWAGIAVAAQAATVGVKVASRAMDAVRKSLDRP